MKYLTLAFAALSLAACSNQPAQTVDVSNQISGPQIFKQYCQTCHGADGKLGLNGAKDLSVSALSVEQRIELITNGKGVMTPFRTILTPEQIHAVAEYTQSLK